MKWFKLPWASNNMPGLLPLTSAAIADYRNHLESFPRTEQPILDYLVRHINGLMCSEIEQVVTRFVKERLALGCRDEATSNYLLSFRRSSIRNATFSEIGRTLALFGNDYRENFDANARQTLDDSDIEKLGIAVSNRNADAHDSPPSITFGELEVAYNVATTVMDAVQQTLQT